MWCNLQEQIMAKDNNKKNPISIPDIKTKRRRALILLSISVVIICAVIAFFILLKSLMFQSNPRFAFRELSVASPGYWNKKDAELIRYLKLQKNSNIFSIDIRKVRSDLRRIPSVEDARVVRILPDTLHIDITERTPRAIINYPRSRWVVDENCIVMERRRSIATQIKIPVITGIPHGKLAGGDRLTEVKPAINLINTIIRNFPDMEMLQLSISDPEQLDFYIRYRNGSTYHVIMPKVNRGFDFMLRSLQSAIIHAYRLGDRRTTYNLSFDGQVVIN